MRHPIGRRILGMFAGVILALAAAQPIETATARAEPQTITIFAAASLKNALDEIAARYEAETGVKVTASLAGSSMLARQIQYGAPADVFISANQAWMDLLERDGVIAAETRRDLLSNRLALIAPAAAVADDARAGREDPQALARDVDLLGLLGDGRIALALVDAVPAGIYAKAALVSLGAWPEIAPRAAQTDNVRAALALVAAGEAPLGIVYASDVVAEGGVRSLGVFPEDWHPPIRYPVAAVSARKTPVILDFLAFLRSPLARAAFERQGFSVLSD